MLLLSNIGQNSRTDREAYREKWSKSMGGREEVPSIIVINRKDAYIDFGLDLTLLPCSVAPCCLAETNSFLKSEYLKNIMCEHNCIFVISDVSKMQTHMFRKNLIRMQMPFICKCRKSSVSNTMTCSQI